jgi:hypothetical protein
MFDHLNLPIVGLGVCTSTTGKAAEILGCADISRFAVAALPCPPAA